MLRRDLLRAAAASAALVLLPRDAQAAWARATEVLASPLATQPASPFTAAQRATLAALADGIIPRTDTPSATDVGVLAWIDVIAADYYSMSERTTLTTGLDAINELSERTHGMPLAALNAAAQGAVMTALDAGDRGTPAPAAFQRVKGLVVHGYFTSERVQKTVLKTQIMPGRFVGDAPMTPRTGGRND